MFPDWLLICFSKIKCFQSVFPAIQYTAAFSHSFNLLYSCLDLFQFNSVPHMLDLKIFSSCEIQISICTTITQVSCPIIAETFFSCLPDFKMLIRFLTVSVISQCQGFPSHTDFPLLFRLGNNLHIFIQKKYLSSFKWHSYRKLFPIFIHSFHRIIRTVTCNFCWSIQIYELCPRQSTLPYSEQFNRHDFSTEKYFLYFRWNFVFQPLKYSKHPKCRCSPDQHSNFSVTDIVKQK